MPNGGNVITARGVAQPQDGTQDLIITGILIAIAGVVVIAIIQAITRPIQ